MASPSSSIPAINQPVCYEDDPQYPGPDDLDKYGVCELEPQEFLSSETLQKYQELTSVNPQSSMPHFLGLSSLFVAPAFAGTGSAMVVLDNDGDGTGDDSDGDNIADDVEWWLAQTYSPMLQYDEEEAYGPPNRPIRILWQVHPQGCIGQNCSSPMRVTITYNTLYEKDGGRWCNGIYGGNPINNHNGDNEAIRFYVDLSYADLYSDPNSIKPELLKAYFNQHEGGSWYNGSSLETRGSENRPLVYVSEDKHASYASKNECEHYDVGGVIGGLDKFCGGEDCEWEGPSGQGGWRGLFTDMVSPNDNVGEVAHPLIGQLGGVFPGEWAWGTSDFCGGYRDKSNCASPNYSKWDISSFSKSGGPISFYNSSPDPLFLDEKPDPGKITFNVTSHVPKRVYFKYVTADHTKGVPGPDTAYYLDSYGVQASHSLKCTPHESICIGAWTLTNNTEGQVWKEWYRGYQANGTGMEGCYPCEGQTVPWSPYIPGKVGLTNTANRDVYYSVRYPGGSWSESSTFPPYSSTEIDALKNGAIEIKIVSESGSVQYLLTPQKKYQIFWNASKNIWDVSELVAQEQGSTTHTIIIIR